MRRISRMFLALLGLGLMAIALLPFSEEHAGATQPMPVNVTNTPLPVQGMVSVGNTPNVNIANAPSVSVTNVPNVNVANSPNVNVANTPNVNVANSSIAVANALDASTNPVPIIVSHRIEPYYSDCDVPQSPPYECSLASIKAGKILVIQQFAFYARSQPGTRFYGPTIFGGLTNSGVSYSFPIFDNGTDNSGALIQATNQVTNIYMDDTLMAYPGPQCSGGATGANYSANCAISGYLISAQ